MGEQLTQFFLGSFGNAEFAQKFFDTLVSYINRVVMEFFHSGANFEILQQKHVN